MSLDWCTDCRVYHFGRERCFPIFELFYDDWYGDEWQEIRGRDIEDAVERWAESSDSDGEYTIVAQTSEPVVRVRPKGCYDERDWKLYRVTGESVPQYHAHDAEWCKRDDCESRGDDKVVSMTLRDTKEPCCLRCHRRIMQPIYAAEREARAAEK